MVTYDQVRELALRLPGVEAGSAYKTPALRVRGKFMSRLREDGESMVIRAEIPEREARIMMDPATYFVTDHYFGGPWLLIRLEHARLDEIEQLLLMAWRQLAPKRLQRELDEG